LFQTGGLGIRFVEGFGVNRSRLLLSFALTLLFLPLELAAQWKEISPAVDFAEFSRSPVTYHVTRVDLTDRNTAVVASGLSDRGQTVTRYARKIDAIAAVNGDYFDEKMRPIGLAIGSCGKWPEKGASQRREALVALGTHRADIIEPAAVISNGAPSWARYAVSGWPMLVRGCRALSSSEMPGSDAFTRSPHPRTAVALSKDGKTLYLVVADGTVSEGVTGVTLPQLAVFLREQLGACEAVNLDGGGSSTMVIDGKKMTTARGGEERAVANHIAVVASSDIPSCERGSNAPQSVADADFWGDVREITESGTPVGKTFTMELHAKGAESFASMRLQRLSSGVLLTAFVPLASSADRDSFQSVVSENAELKSVVLEGGDGDWGVLTGRLGGVAAAHALRKLSDALGLESNGNGANTAATLRPVTALFGKRARPVAGGVRVTIAEPAALSRASDLLFTTDGSDASLRGVVIVPKGRAALAKKRLESAGITVRDQKPWLLDAAYLLLSVEGEGEADVLAKGLSAAMQR
jgi:uncharacterized protein YigE (DUF2233 family)